MYTNTLDYLSKQTIISAHLIFNKERVKKKLNRMLCKLRYR